MIKGAFFIKGTLTIIVGIITIFLSFIYLYYYFSNKKGKLQDKKLFGPTPIIITNLLINVVLLIMALSFVYVYIKTSKEEYFLGCKIDEICPILSSKRYFVKKTLEHIPINK
jgi:uncharacterized membrane protein